MNGWLRLVSVVLVLGWSVPVLAASDYEDGVRELTKAIVAEAGKLNKQNLAVVDRNQLNKIFKEHELSMLGISDPEAIKKVGKVAGADALITGSITEMADSVRVTAKVMATDTARVIAAAKTTIPKTGTIADLVKQGIEAPGAKVTEKSAEKPTSSSKPAPAQAAMKVEAQNFQFALQECKKGGSQIACFFLLTNLADDRDITVNSGACGATTRLLDTNGNLYPASQVALGNQTQLCSVYLKMISKIPTKMKLTFDKIASETIGIAVVEVNSFSGLWFTAQFRDVPLTQ